MDHKEIPDDEGESKQECSLYEREESLDPDSGYRDHCEIGLPVFEQPINFPESEEEEESFTYIDHSMVERRMEPAVRQVVLRPMPKDLPVTKWEAKLDRIDELHEELVRVRPHLAHARRRWKNLDSYYGRIYSEYADLDRELYMTRVGVIKVKSYEPTVRASEPVIKDVKDMNSLVDSMSDDSRKVLLDKLLKKFDKKGGDKR